MEERETERAYPNQRIWLFLKVQHRGSECRVQQKRELLDEWDAVVS